MATPGKQTDGEAVSISHLSNDELGAIWVDTLRSSAMRRTGSTRNYWREFLREPFVETVLHEFRRRIHEREEEYDAWLQLSEYPGL